MRPRDLICYALTAFAGAAFAGTFAKAATVTAPHSIIGTAAPVTAAASTATTVGSWAVTPGISIVDVRIACMTTAGVPLGFFDVPVISNVSGTVTLQKGNIANPIGTLLSGMTGTTVSESVVSGVLTVQVTPSVAAGTITCESFFDPKSFTSP